MSNEWNFFAGTFCGIFIAGLCSLTMSHLEAVRSGLFTVSIPAIVAMAAYAIETRYGKS